MARGTRPARTLRLRVLLLAATVAALLALGADTARAANCTVRAYAESDALQLALSASVTNLCFALDGGAAHGMSHVIVYVAGADLAAGETLVVRNATGSTVLSVPVASGSSYHVLVASNATLEMNGTHGVAYVGWQWIASSNLSVGLPRIGESTASANVFNIKSQQVLYFFVPTPSGTIDVQLNSYYGASGDEFSMLLLDSSTIFAQTVVSGDYWSSGTDGRQQVIRATGAPTRGSVIAVYASLYSGMSLVSGPAQCSSPVFTNSSGSFTDGSDFWSYASSCSFTLAPAGATLFAVNLTRVDLDPATLISITAGANTYGPYAWNTLPSAFLFMAPVATFTMTSTFGPLAETYDGINGTFAVSNVFPPGPLSSTNPITTTLAAGGIPLLFTFSTSTESSVTLQFVVTAPNGVMAGLMLALVRHFALPSAAGEYDYRIVHSSQVQDADDFAFASTSDTKTVTATLTGLTLNSVYFVQLERGNAPGAPFDVTISIVSSSSSSLAITIGTSVGASVLLIIIVVGSVTGIRSARRKRARAHPVGPPAPEPMQVVLTANGYFAVPVSQIDSQTMSPLGQFSMSSTSNLLTPDVSISMMQSIKMNSLAVPGAAPSVSVEEVDDENVPDVVVNNWQKGSLLGRGGFGRVYMGLNLDTGEIIAVKQIQIGGLDGMSNDDYQMVRQEVNLMRQLKHKNIVRYLGCERTEEDLNIFLEFVPGGSLASIISRFGHLSEDVIKVYCREILHGLRYLHNKGVIHRDIKGANILVGRNSCCKLADFGASRELEGMMSRASIKGTPYFMAPEVIQQRRTTSAADIWSFGCTVIEMATGRPPFADSVNQIAVMFAITSGTEAIPIPENLSPAGRDFVQICLNRNAEARPTADDLLHHPFLTETSDAAPAHNVLVPGSVGSPTSSSGQHSGHFSSNDALPEKPPPPVMSSLDGPRRLGQFSAGDDNDDDDDDDDETGETEEPAAKPAKGGDDDDEESSFSSTTDDDDDDDDDDAGAGAGAGISPMEAMLRA